ncbi:Non-specific lipid transfer protein gpi-anchored 1 like, partial [Thalictrum thalictroides]
MRTQSSLVFFTLLLFCFLNGSVFCAAPPTVEAQCSNEFSKVGVCLSFATGKADSPTKDCCTKIEEIKDKNPVCLCFVIQQAHDGASSLKSMGLQEAKLLELPSACKLANASISECP